MKVYQDLAPYYDRFMSFIDYETEAEYLYRLAFQQQKTKGHLLDIGAGSGGHMLPLLRMGMHVDGLDYSENMIAVLQNKMTNEGLSGRLFTEDMRCFHVSSPYDMLYCFGESIHHLANVKELGDFLGCAFEALKPGGMLLFSWQEKQYFDDLANYGEFYERHGDDYLLWQTEILADDGASLSYTAFIQQADNSYQRILETHRVTIYKEKQIVAAAKAARFKVRSDLEALCFDELLTEEPLKHITILEKDK